MSIIGIDIGSSTTKIIEYKNEKIASKKIVRKVYEKTDLEKFLFENNIENIEKIVFTGIGADKVNTNTYNIETEKIEEFEAISTGGLFLAHKDEAIIVSVGTGTAIIEKSNGKIQHLGGTGVGAGTLFNLCNRMLGINSFDEILELSKKGDIRKIDLRIGDITTKEISTLPLDLTLSNFGKFEADAKKADIVTGIVNMVFEVIGMMAAFASINSKNKEIVVIGNITAIPMAEEILKKIEFTHKIKFYIPSNTEYGVALGAVISSLNKK